MQSPPEKNALERTGAALSHLGRGLIIEPVVFVGENLIIGPVRGVANALGKKAEGEKKVAMPTFLGDGEAMHEGRPSDSWEMMPGDVEDPRYDRHGFRRDASRLRHEAAFESLYEPRLVVQEQRWGRCTEKRAELSTLAPSELKHLARLGIPAARRKHVWPQLCRAAELKAASPEGHFAALLAMPAATSPQDPGFAAERQIDLDLARTFPGHRLLSSPDGAARLRQVLVAYARRDPSVGYVQGMGFVAALLLVFLEDPEESFWCLCSVIEWLLPEDYFNRTLLGLRVEQSVFSELVASKLPRLSQHLEHHCCVVELFATRWFVALYANALPIETTLRVWDAFLLEGCKVIHRVGLALLRIAEPRLLACHDQQELLCALQEEHAHCLDVERLLSVAFDKFSFLRSFPRGRIDALRRKHRSRLLVAEGDDSDSGGGGSKAAAAAGGDAAGGIADSSTSSATSSSSPPPRVDDVGPPAAASPVSRPPPRPRQVELYGVDHALSSSDEEDGMDDVDRPGEGFDVVSSLDDLKETSAGQSFWL